jgi:hypothetical protein
MGYPPSKVTTVDAHLKGGSMVRGWSPASTTAFTGADWRTVASGDRGDDMRCEEDEGKGETQVKGIRGELVTALTEEDGGGGVHSRALGAVRVLRLAEVDNRRG